MKRVNGAEMAWSNGKSAILDLKTADLNGDFRLDVVSTRKKAFRESLVPPGEGKVEWEAEANRLQNW